MWTDAIIKRLSQLYCEQKTYTEITAALEQEFEHQFTRNQIAGKLHRLRLDGRVGRAVKKEGTKRCNKRLEDKDTPRNDLYNFCQWILDSGHKCHHRIDQRYPGVDNYCVHHQVIAVRPDRRDKVRVFHGIHPEAVLN